MAGQINQDTKILKNGLLKKCKKIERHSNLLPSVTKWFTIFHHKMFITETLKNLKRRYEKTCLWG